VRASRSTFVALAAALALGVAGCGEKSEPETTGPVVSTPTGPDTTQSTSTVTETGGQDGGGPPRALARMAIETFLTAGDPVVCERYATARYVRAA